MHSVQVRSKRENHFFLCISYSFYGWFSRTKEFDPLVDIFVIPSLDYNVNTPLTNTFIHSRQECWRRKYYGFMSSSSSSSLQELPDVWVIPWGFSYGDFSLDSRKDVFRGRENGALASPARWRKQIFQIRRFGASFSLPPPLLPAGEL